MMQFIIGIIVLFLFLSFLFFILGYVVLPLVILFFALAFAGRAWEWGKSLFKSAEPIEHLEPAPRRRATKKHQVIDVDYTEV